MGLPLEHGQKAGKDICEALGLDPAYITRLEIVLSVGHAAHVNVTRFLSTTEMGELREVLEHYTLLPEEPG